jgi:hypothetical protein
MKRVVEESTNVVKIAAPKPWMHDTERPPNREQMTIYTSIVFSPYFGATKMMSISEEAIDKPPQARNQGARNISLKSFIVATACSFGPLRAICKVLELVV